MILRFQHIENIGRFNTWDSRAARADEVRFGRLTLLYARNASGKSTLARLLASAAGSDAAEVLRHRTVGSTGGLKAVLEWDAGVQRFDGNDWVGNTAPTVLVFDRDFIEANVYVGRRTSKDQRKNLLRIALGEDEVALAKELDDLTAAGKRLAKKRRQEERVLGTAARDFGLSVERFLELEPVFDASARTRAEAAHQRAIAAKEIRRRPLPAILPALPRPDLDKLERLLSADRSSIGDVAEARVRAHLEGRLGGRGDRWVREGLREHDGEDCPFCGQDMDGVELVTLYRRWFDQAVEQQLSGLETLAKQAGGLQDWWVALKRRGVENLKCFQAWEDADGVERPELDSKGREASLDQSIRQIQQAVDIGMSQEGTREHWGSLVAGARAGLQGLRDAVGEYNASIAVANKRIESILQRLDRTSVDQAKRAVRLLDARERRHAEDMVVAVEALRRNAEEREEVEAAKKQANERMRARSQDLLDQFCKRVNALLCDLCADFAIGDLGTERTGGNAGARFEVMLETGTLAVANPSGEEQLARVLSEGDRSTLALAVFLASIDRVEDLADTVIVFDDPMTSLDEHRCGATAEQICKLAPHCRQVLVLSHHAPFLAQVAYDWRRHGSNSSSDLVQVELVRGTRRLRPWSAKEELRSEQEKRLDDVKKFVAAGGAADDDAPIIRAELRKLLEGHMRHRCGHLFKDHRDTLEPILRELKANTAVRATTPFSADQVTEMERICSFGARANHDASHSELPKPSPEEVRRMAERALAVVAS